MKSINCMFDVLNYLCYIKYLIRIMKELIYKIIDLLTSGKGLSKVFSGIKVKIPTRYINYFWSSYEQDNFEFLKEKCKPNDVIIDIGAHIGLFSCIAAKCIGPTGKVYSFEPTPVTYEVLNKTIKINKLENIIEPYDEAVGIKEGKTVFYISELAGDNANSLVNYVDSRGALKGIDVKVTSVDNFVNKRKIGKVNFIKVDVEGAEYDTIRGAENTLKNLRPFCILAIHPAGITSKGDKLGDIYDFIIDCRYNILCNGQPISKEKFCIVTDLIYLHLLRS